MSRRTGQTGHIEKSGKWWVIRWWTDVPGQEKRELKRAKLWPVAGPGALSASERKRRGREVIAGSGADTVEYFNELVKRQRADVLTFEQQSKRWVELLQKRKRKPVASSTIPTGIFGTNLTFGPQIILNEC